MLIEVYVTLEVKRAFYLFRSIRREKEEGFLGLGTRTCS